MWGIDEKCGCAKTARRGIFGHPLMATLYYMFPCQSGVRCAIPRHGGYVGEYLRRARTARYLYGAFPRNSLGFPPPLIAPTARKPLGGKRLLGQDRWPNLRAAPTASGASLVDRRECFSSKLHNTQTCLILWGHENCNRVRI